MKYDLMLSCVLLAALTACSTVPEPERNSAPPAPQVKPLTPQQEAAAKKKAEAEARRKAAEAFRKKNLELAAKLRAISEARGKNHAERIAEVKKLLPLPEYAEPHFQWMLLEQIVRLCQIPSWQGITQFDFDLPARELEGPARAILNMPDIGFRKKQLTLSVLAVHLCDTGKYKEAEALVRKFLDRKDMPAEDRFMALNTLKNVFRLQDRYGDAVKVLEEMEKIDAVKGLYARADLAAQFGRAEEADRLLNAQKDPYVKIMYYVSRQTRGNPMGPSLAPNRCNDWVRGPGQKEAADFVRNAANGEQRRVDVALSCLFEEYGTDGTAAARRSLAGAPA